MIVCFGEFLNSLICLLEVYCQNSTDTKSEPLEVNSLHRPREEIGMSIECSFFQSINSLLSHDGC